MVRRDEEALVLGIMTVGFAAYACLTCMAAPPSIIHAICLNGRDEPMLEVYYRVPCALGSLIVIAWGTRRRHLSVNTLARCAGAVSTGIWVAAVGMARGWW